MNFPVRDRKIIVLDGPDMCGKTNIAQGLSLEHKIPYYKMSHEIENWNKPKTWKYELSFGERRQVDLIKQLKIDAVIDRAYPSEWVYSKIFGRDTDHDLLKRFDEEYARLGSYIVIPLKHDYSQNTKDDLIKNEDIQDIHNEYLNFAKWSKCDCRIIYVDSFKNDLKWELDMLRPEIRFGETIQFSSNVTLDRFVQNKVGCEQTNYDCTTRFHEWKQVQE